VLGCLCVCVCGCDSLPHLIFLDLYNNRISEISNLDCMPGLRVLMLGKNRISEITNLHVLSKLDVLDLHVRACALVCHAAMLPCWLANLIMVGRSCMSPRRATASPRSPG